MNTLLALLLLPIAHTCLNFDGTPLQVNNQQMTWLEVNMPNQWEGRGHAQGTIGTVYPDRNGHKHFQGVITGGTVEIVYNLDFGTLPPIRTGGMFEACGDFIVSTEPTAQYPASPDKAVLHWVHPSNDPRHPSGFLIIGQ